MIQYLPNKKGAPKREHLFCIVQLQFSFGAYKAENINFAQTNRPQYRAIHS